MGKKGKVFSQWLSLAAAVQVKSPCTLSSKEELIKENEQLCLEADILQREQKKLKQVLERLKADYEESKYFDPLRRYSRLKAMVKRTILHLILNGNDGSAKNSSYQQNGLVNREYSQYADTQKRRDFTDLSKQELVDQKKELLDNVNRIRKQTLVIKDSILLLERHYGNSKNYSPLQRYRLLKEMVKNVTRS